MDKHLSDAFFKAFAHEATAFAAAPGRTELGGNHTDHQHGCVLAAAVDLVAKAAAAKNGLSRIRVLSEGYPAIEIDLNDLSVRADERGTTAALIRGTAARFQALGVPIDGFDAYVTSSVLPGSGLSSSAAFEVLIGSILNGLSANEKFSDVELAKIAQYAENVYFGKPCGLMDQMASSVGGVIGIDFATPEAPVIERIAFDFSESGYALCIVDSGADHANLTDAYAAIPQEMGAVAALFEKHVLREVDEAAFFARLNEVRTACGDRAALRAMHFFAENARVGRQIEALQAGDMQAFLREVNASGRSSEMLLQNIVPDGFSRHQDMAIALALAKRALGGKGACRVHGGGFAGTIQAFVPQDALDGFRAEIEAALGAGRCHVLTVRRHGGEIVTIR